MSREEPSMYDEEIIMEQIIRQEANKFSDTNIPLREDNDRMSAVSERAFLNMLGEPWSLLPTKKHPGFQFTLNGNKVKVYACDKGRNLLIRQRPKRPAWADVYVLVWVIGDRARIMGWCEREMVEHAPVRVMKADGRYKLPAHFVPFTSLNRDVKALRQRLGYDHRQEGLF